MFGGKREKALEAELAAVKEENQHRKGLLKEIAEQKDNVTEQFTRMMASHAQMEKDVEQIKEDVQSMLEMAENSSVAAGDIHNVMIEINNGVETYDANHTFFMGQVRQQNEKIMEIVENNKHFTTPMKYISETPAALKSEGLMLKERALRMAELSKNMSVLSLNAAIEAGRLGESGSRFITAAEEVRTYSETYEREARELEEDLEKSQARISELEEQVHHLNELLKENNISMGRLYKDCIQNTTAYDAKQIDLRGMVSDAIVGKADALQQSEQESAKTQEQVLAQVGEVEDELREHKNCADELESMCKKLQKYAEKGN